MSVFTELTNERDVDVDAWFGVSDNSRTDRYVMCHFAASRDRLPQRLVALPRLLTKMLDLEPETLPFITHCSLMNIHCRIETFPL